MRGSTHQPEKVIAAALCLLLTLFMTVEAGHSHPPSRALNHSFCVWCFTAHTATVPATAMLFATLAGTGMRCGEAFGLHVDDLDLAAGRICIRRSVWNGEEGTVKTKRGYRTVNIDPALVAMLAEHLDERTSGRVFATRNGTPFCKGNVRRKLNQILKSLKLAPAGLHAFRHGRVSVLQASGVPGDLVKEWVGHSSLQTTSLYTHFQDDFRQRIAREVALFSGENMVGKLLVGPNGPNLPSFAASAGAL
jgi:integrase